MVSLAGNSQPTNGLVVTSIRTLSPSAYLRYALLLFTLFHAWVPGPTEKRVLRVRLDLVLVESLFLPQTMLPLPPLMPLTRYQHDGAPRTVESWNIGIKPNIQRSPSHFDIRMCVSSTSHEPCNESVVQVQLALN
jgi:hypothetical protein